VEALPMRLEYKNMALSAELHHKLKSEVTMIQTSVSQYLTMIMNVSMDSSILSSLPIKKLTPPVFTLFHVSVLVEPMMMLSLKFQCLLILVLLIQWVAANPSLLVEQLFHFLIEQKSYNMIWW
jgi:hypothetical protein